MPISPHTFELREHHQNGISCCDGHVHNADNGEDKSHNVIIIGLPINIIYDIFLFGFMTMTLRLI